MHDQRADHPYKRILLSKYVGFYFRILREKIQMLRSSQKKKQKKKKQIFEKKYSDFTPKNFSHWLKYLPVFPQGDGP